MELHEAGFDGELVIEGDAVRITGTRPQDGADVVKDVPVGRDRELTELVELVRRGDHAAGVRLLAHVGVLDPS